MAAFSNQPLAEGQSQLSLKQWGGYNVGILLSMAFCGEALPLQLILDCGQSLADYV